MAMIDEAKLQGRILEILDILRKQQSCCNKVVSTQYATSSGTGGIVFVLIFADGTLEVRDLGPNGTVLTSAEYGTLTQA